MWDWVFGVLSPFEVEAITISLHRCLSIEVLKLEIQASCKSISSWLVA
jgi:hypothetical protein